MGDKPTPLVFLLARELVLLPEYSHTIPTGTTPGKRWRRRTGTSWLMGAYYATPELDALDRTGIAWFAVVVVDTELARSTWLDHWRGDGDPRRFVAVAS